MSSTDELREAHDVLAEFYVERLAGAHDQMPIDRSVLDLFCGLVVGADRGVEVADVGCGTGRLEPHLAAGGLQPHGLDLSPEMVRVARRDHPDFDFQLGDVRELPFADASLAGVVCWYSLMYLTPEDRPGAFAELARVTRPGGHLVTAWKQGDDQVRRGGRTTGLGIEFDVYWLSMQEMEAQVVRAGFETLFWAGRPAADGENSPQAYLISRRRPTSSGTSLSDALGAAAPHPDASEATAAHRVVPELEPVGIIREGREGGFDRDRERLP